MTTQLKLLSMTRVAFLAHKGQQMNAVTNQDEYKFPDESVEVEVEGLGTVVIKDDTPPEDRNRDPLPKNIVDELDKDELDEYSDKVKIKLKQFKKVWHDERRAKEQALREHQEAISYSKKLLDENNGLKGRLTAGEKTYVDTYKNAADLELKAARAEYKDAYDAGDSDRLLDAQEKLNAASFKLQKVSEYTPVAQRPTEGVYSQPEGQVARPDPRAIAWQERNNWFGQDEEMTSLALGLHTKLVKEYGPQYVGTDEYYQKIDGTMRKRFPENYSDEGDQSDAADTARHAPTKSGANSTQPARNGKPSTVVAPVTRSTSSRKIVLTQSQAQLAKKLGVSLEQYAREMTKLEASNV